MSPFKFAVGIASNVAIFGVLVFLPAGTLEWGRAWIFLGVVLVGAVASTVAVSRANPAVLAERYRSPVKKGQPLADKILVSLDGYDAYRKRVRYRLIPLIW